MKVQDLIKKLQELDGELDVICSTEDESLCPSGHLLRLLMITEVDVVEAEEVRGEDGIASFKLGRSCAAKEHAVIGVTGDF
ncbi:hypothetical protein ACLSSQ_16290 [Azospira sp. APE16]|uniref:hypothetical protein n=1 Tax=Azospira sp. APE16 TaxID=3394231 RepID=UPI003A4DB251